MIPLAMFGLGGQELLIILVIVLVLFGASRVPKLMRGLGQGIKEFKDATHEGAESDESTVDNPPSADKESN